MSFNFYIVFIAALIPLLVGSVWYHDRVFGKTWIKASGLPDDITKSGNMLIIFGLTYVLGLFVAVMLAQIVVHQFGFYQMMMINPEVEISGTEANQLLMSVMGEYGQAFRDAKHGALHGGLTAITLALPFIGITALFERRGWKYIAIHAGYWFITLVIMGALICEVF